MNNLFKFKKVSSLLCCIVLICTSFTGGLIVPIKAWAATLSLSSYFNKDMFSYDSNRSDGSSSSLYSADLASSSLTVNGASYTLGSFINGANNALECSGQTITLTQAKYSAIGFLGVATNTDSTGIAAGKFRINYADGTYSETCITFTDWATSDNNQYIAQTMAHRHINGVDYTGNTYIYAYYLYPTPGKVVASVKLSSNSQIKILAMSTFSGVSVDLGKDFNRDGFSQDTSRNDGNLDGYGSTYAYELFPPGGTYYGRHTVVNNDMAYNMSAGIGEFNGNEFSNVVDCKGQYIVMPQGKYTSIVIAGAATNGDKTGTFTMYYSDGTSTTANITMKDWCTTDTSGQTILKTMTHRHVIPSADETRNNYIFLYTISPTSTKTLTKLGLPNNSNMHINAISCTVADQTEVVVPAPSPRVVSTTYSTEDVPVIMYSVTDFGAAANDTEDDTVAFQRALDAAYVYGGGVVFAPAGQYVFNGHISIPQNVTLRGDWRNPDSGIVTGCTILKAYESKNDENGAPFISMHNASALREITIWYPEQTSTTTVYPYPWTISTENDITYGPTVKNVTLVNSFKGINATIAAGGFFRNVYGTVLKTGLYIDRIGDILRPQTVYFRPQFWANSGLGTPPTVSNIATYTRTNATGVIIKRNDWGYMYDVYLESFKTALVIDKTANVTQGWYYNGQIMNLTIADSTTGIDIKFGSSKLPILISNSTINTVGADGVSVKAESTFGSDSTVTFNTCSITSPNGFPVQMDGDGVFNFVHCTFGDHDATKYAVTATKGSLILEGNTFSIDKPDFTLGDNMSSATVLGNSFQNNTPNYYCNVLLGDKKVDNGALSPSSFEQAPGNPTLPSYRKPSNNNIYNVKSYGAVGNGTTDDTSAFQSALNAASSAGGGTVYVPGGYYLIAGGLNVASNVELRGISEGPHHFGTSPRGSVLYATSSSSRLITLEANAGVRGLSIFYPNQVYNNPIAYPDTILFNGTGDYVFDVTFANSYVAMNVQNGGYYIDSTRGIGLSKYVYINGVSTAGYLVNIQDTMGDWQDMLREENAPRQDWWQGNPSFLGYAFDLNSSSNILSFNCFTFGVGYGTYIHGTSSNNTFYGLGHDATLNGILLDGSGTNNKFINTQLTAPGSTDHWYIIANSTYTGSVKLFSTGVWGPCTGISLSGGTVILQQLCTDAYGVLHHVGGTMNLESSVFGNNPNQIKLYSTITDAYVLACLGYGGSLGVINDKGDPDVWMNIRK